MTHSAVLARRIAGALTGVCTLASLAALGSFLVVAAGRLGYPFDLEWMEGGMVDHVVRVRAGLPLYVAPTPTFVPFPYPPLFYWVSAGLSRLVGLGYPAIRITAILASLGLFALIAAHVRRETRDGWAALLAAGLFAATYRRAGAWLDIGRVDSLFLALSLGSVYLVRFGSSRRWDAVAAVILVLAGLTKQPASLLAGTIAVALLMADRQRGVFLGLAVFGGMAMAHGVLQMVSHGWYGYYVFRLPRGFSARILEGEIVAFWTRDIFQTFGLAAILAGAWLGRGLLARGRSVWIYLGAAVGMVGGSWLTRIQYGGYDNTLLPAYAILALLAGMGAAAVRRRGAGHWRSAVVAAACMAQFLFLAYDPQAQIPTGRDRREGELLVERIAAIEGEVLVPYHGFWPSRVGASGAHRMAVSDVLGCDPNGQGPVLRAQFSDLLSSGRVSAVVLDRDDWFFMEDVNQHYPRIVPAFSDSTAFWPRTGWPIRPLWIHLPDEP